MFHEVGAVDSIVDVCSVAICLDNLGIEDIVVESLSEGHGTIRCAHGLMPIPVPAVVNLCQAGNIALTPAPVAGELVTPRRRHRRRTAHVRAPAGPLPHRGRRLRHR